MQFSFFVYKHLLIPILKKLLTVFRLWLPRKISEAVRLKQELFLRDLKNLDAPIWIHSSSGEIEYAKPVIRELKKKYPKIPILVTYSSISAQKLIAGILEIDDSCIIPWETTKDFELFLNHYRPRCLLIARTDVWPVMMEQTYLKKIPSLLFSATLTNDSSRTKGFGLRLSQFSLSKLSQIFCVSKLDWSVFQSLKIKTPIHVTGDTRFEQVQFRLKNPQAVKLELKPSSLQNILVAGSTWPEDDQVLFQALKLKPDLRCIWAPHEVSEDSIRQIEKNLNQLQISSVRYSLASSWNDQRVLLIDHVGILADIYSWGQVAFVGGSFREKVHSVMEPLASAKPVIVGPHYTNNREAQEFSELKFQAKGANSSSALPLSLVTRVLTPRQFTDSINAFMSLDESSQSDLANMLHREISNRLGSTKSAVDWLEKNCENLKI